MVHYARANDWICLFVPNTFAIAREGKVLIPSKTRPGMVDQPDIAIEILRNVRVCVLEARCVCRCCSALGSHQFRAPCVRPRIPLAPRSRSPSCFLPANL